MSLYGGQEITHPDIIAAFNKEFPFIKVPIGAGRAADLMTRIVAERRADKYLADVMASGPNGPRMLYLNKMLDPIAPSVHPSGSHGCFEMVRRQTLVRRSGEPVYFHVRRHHQQHRTFLQYQNRQPGEIKSFWDLLAPKWKGKLLGMDPRSSALPTPVLILYHRDDVGAGVCAPAI